MKSVFFPNSPPLPVAPDATEPPGRMGMRLYSTIAGCDLVHDGTAWRAPSSGAAPAAGRRVTQILSVYAEGTTAIHCGLVSFAAGERLAADSQAMIGNAGSSGDAVLELLSEVSGEVLCAWSTNTSLAAVVLSAEVAFASALVCSLVLRGELATTRAVLRGLDWKVM